jgi:Fur family transcriptional regulator, ferric uptake regulator
MQVLAFAKIFVYGAFMKTSSVDQLILGFAAQEKNHFTPQEIFENLKSFLPAVNQSTVYRSLERLVKTGKVSVSDLGTGSLVYELVGEGLHHHLICQNCHQIILLPHDDVDKFFKHIEQESRYQVITNHLILYGICEECRPSK